MGDAGYVLSSTAEPHAIRRAEILKKYPEITKLYGHCPKTKYIVTCVVIAQISIAIAIRNASWPVFILTAYAVGGTFNDWMTLAMHELSHYLGFESMQWNRIWSLIANLPLGIPSAISFKKYHLDHHSNQGDDGVDVDIPTEWEISVFKGRFMKLLFVLLQSLFYSLRPLFLNPKPICKWTIINFIIQFTFDFCLAYFVSPACLGYLILSTLLGMGLHPCAGHFIAEHFLLYDDKQETYSYYGPLNIVSFNVGYHNEHHDFPRVPGSRLPLVREIASEYYENLAEVKSWPGALWTFVTDDKIELNRRVKRNMISGNKKSD